jgi:hypothetical protein
MYVANMTPVDVAVVAAPDLALAAAVPSVDVADAVVATVVPVESAHADCDPVPPGQVAVAVVILTAQEFFKVVTAATAEFRSTSSQKLHAYSHERPSCGASSGKNGIEIGEELS